MTLAELQNLDPNNIGSWPGLIRSLVILLMCAALLGGGFYFDTRDQIAELETHIKKEKELKQTFEVKQRKAANLAPLKRFLAEIQQSFGAMLRLLPNKTEIEGLLVEISQAGLASGLEFQLFKPEREQPAEFYAIQPIRIRVTGTYHQFGKFISDVAALPRIVTQHNLVMTPQRNEKGGKGKKTAGVKLGMSLVAKTYRYLEEDEIAALNPKKKK